MYFAICICIVLIIVIYIWISRKRAKYGMPPGPKGLPLIGSVLDVDPENIHVALDRWAQKYGSLYGLKILNEQILVISSADVTRAACLSDPAAPYLCDTPERAGAKIVFYGQNDIIFGLHYRDEHRKMLRKLCHQLIKAYGNGMQRIESIATNEMRFAVGKFQASNGESLDPRPIIHTTICNTIGILLLGRSFQEGDRELKNMNDFLTAGNQILTVGTDTLLTMMPFLKYLPAYRKQIKDVEVSRARLIADFVTSSRETLDPNDVRGMIDELIIHPDVTDDDVKAVAVDMIGAGILTTSTSLQAIILILLHHPNVQQKIQEEIDDVIGGHKMPTIDDRRKMPYVEAVIIESLRYISHLPIAGIHSASDDVTFMGYHIKKYTTILINTWTIHHSEEVWGDPWTFRPERFLDNDGNLLLVDHPLRRSLVTFGIGHRSCIGEVLARLRIFLFLTSVLQTFDLEAGSDKLPSADPRTYQSGLLLTPKPYTLRAVPRKVRD